MPPPGFSKPGHCAQANFLAIFIIYCKEQVGTKRNPPFRIISPTEKPGAIPALLAAWPGNAPSDPDKLDRTLTNLPQTNLL